MYVPRSHIRAMFCIFVGYTVHTVCTPFMMPNIDSNMAFVSIVASLVPSVSTTTLHHMGAVHLGGVQLTTYECVTFTLAFGWVTNVVYCSAATLLSVSWPYKVMLYLFHCSLNMGGPQGKQSLWTIIYLIILYLLVAIISIVGLLHWYSNLVIRCLLLQAYIVVGNPVFHQVAFGIIMSAISFEAFYVLKWVLWLIPDNVFAIVEHLSSL